MGTTTTVHKWGSGLGVQLSKPFADALGLRRGSKVELSMIGDELRVRPIKSYRIEDLLRGYDGPSPDEYDWGSSAGKEIW
ncbi:MAG: hypothetical protein LBG97_03350 [Coriobacteriales bacterium]|jgi:antitoxin MazE|nr:hypothetical protein [Coriobacteriales bacterium]